MAKRWFSGEIMKAFMAFFKPLAALAVVPVALDWRSPVLVDIRPWALMGLIVVTLILILAETWALHTREPGQRMFKVLSALGLLAAAFALITTLALEARFHWVRHQVLQADADRLEKLGRHVIVGYRDLRELQELVRLRAIAGIFLSTHNVRGKDVAEVRQDIRSLQNQRREQRLPRLWVATDQEGGVVSRLSPPLTRLPALSEIVESYPEMPQREDAVRQYALTQGRELAGLGVNVNFAPVVDINHQIANPNDRLTRINQRAISSDPAVVAQVASWYCAAMEDVGVRCTLKHFPGLGRVFEDTHLGCADLGTSVAELTDSDWVPFRMLMRRSGAFTMLGHVRLTALDPKRPASLSAAVIAGLLRDQWKHDGVLITDNFTMMAVYRSSEGIDKGSIEALNAGVDLILVTYDPDQYYRIMYALLNAGENGKLDRNALNESDRRLERAISGIRTRGRSVD